MEKPEILVQYEQFNSEHDEDYVYDEIHEFISRFRRGDLKEFLDWCLDNYKEQTPR